MKTLLSIVAVAAVITLTGCAPDKHITEVKALPFSYPINEFQNPILRVPDPNLTVDQALDYRKVCDSVKWKVDQTEQHQNFVEYRCDYKGVKDSAFAERDKADIVSEGDVYQWTFGSDGHPALNYAGFVIRFKGGSIKDFKMDTVRVMEMASNNKVTNADEAFSYLTNSRIPVKPASPFTDTTYGNTLTAYYPGHTALDAAKLAYQWNRVPVSVSDVDELGYPVVIIGEDNFKQLFPVNPADVQLAKNIDPFSNNQFDILKEIQLSPNKLFCLGFICYNSNAQPVGRAPAPVQALEIASSGWVQVSATNPASQPGKEAAGVPDTVAAAMANTATSPPAPQVAQAAQPTPAAPVTPQVVNSAVAALTGASQPQGQPVANTTVHSGDVGPDGWPKMTPCIQKLQDKFTADQQKQNADTSSSLEQMQEWADVCKSLGQ